MAEEGSGNPTGVGWWGSAGGQDREPVGERLGRERRRSGGGSPLGEECLLHESQLPALQTFQRVVRVDAVDEHLTIALGATDSTPREPSSHQPSP
jgi:hypothetical protein